jgi:hypothetical protein
MAYPCLNLIEQLAFASVELNRVEVFVFVFVFVFLRLALILVAFWWCSQTLLGIRKTAVRGWSEHS